MVESVPRLNLRCSLSAASSFSAIKAASDIVIAAPGGKTDYGELIALAREKYIA
jgi:hypothetical protein